MPFHNHKGHEEISWPSQIKINGLVAQLARAPPLHLSGEREAEASGSKLAQSSWVTMKVPTSPFIVINKSYIITW